MPCCASAAATAAPIRRPPVIRAILFVSSIRESLKTSVVAWTKPQGCARGGSHNLRSCAVRILVRVMICPVCIEKCSTT